MKSLRASFFLLIKRYARDLELAKPRCEFSFGLPPTARIRGVSKLPIIDYKNGRSVSDGNWAAYDCHVSPQWEL